MPTCSSSTPPTWTRTSSCRRSPRPGTLVKAGKRVMLRVSRGPIIDKVENYVGMSLDDVKTHLQTLFASHAPNIVIKTPSSTGTSPAFRRGGCSRRARRPTPRSPAWPTVELVVSQEPGASATVTVGDYVGKSFQEAIQELTQDNIPFSFAVKASSRGADPGSVIAQNPPSGAQVEYGQVVQLTMTAPSSAVGKDNVFGLVQVRAAPAAHRGDHPPGGGVRLAAEGDLLHEASRRSAGRSLHRSGGKRAGALCPGPGSGARKSGADAVLGLDRFCAGRRGPPWRVRNLDSFRAPCYILRVYPAANGRVLRVLASVVKWHYPSFPSWSREFDSPRSLL